MRVLVLGAAGMLGHKLLQRFGPRAVGTVRSASQVELLRQLAPEAEIAAGIDARDDDELRRLLSRVEPTLVLNAIGLVKQRELDPDEAAAINTALPHRLADACRAANARLIHFSTDCVFRGAKGGYRESDTPDADDLYGRSKRLGEVEGPGCLTLRTSIIGRELASTQGLVEWFLSNRGGAVKGYAKAVFSGVPTLELAQAVEQIAEHHPKLEGIYHVAADPIDKLELLRLIDAAYGAGVSVEPDESVVIDRSLDGSRFRTATGLSFPAWPALVERMAADPTPYEEIRRVRT